ncbi:MAG TPA: hypothetical protein VM557_12140 [Thermoanaerobaculia bacterium]|nr:hypothetical protein [Thermoanaerobaculia bacterium]
MSMFNLKDAPRDPRPHAYPCRRWLSGSLGVVVALILLGAPADGLAQSARNAAYLELGGSAIGLSLNYERRFNERWAGRAGFSVVTGETSEDTETTLLFPLTASWLSHPASSHHMELGGGVTIVTGDSQDFFESFDDDVKRTSAFATGIIGYRYQKPGRGFQFRAMATPVAVSGDFGIWAGISLGYAW